MINEVPSKAPNLNQAQKTGNKGNYKKVQTEEPSVFDTRDIVEISGQSILSNTEDRKAVVPVTAEKNEVFLQPELKLAEIPGDGDKSGKSEGSSTNDRPDTATAYSQEETEVGRILNKIV